jgi:hypothetical protein
MIVYFFVCSCVDAICQKGVATMGEQRGCLGFISKLFGENADKTTPQDLPKVQVTNRFVTPAEADFFRVLRHVIGNSGHILAQVSVGKLLYFPGNHRSTPGRQAWRNRVAQKTVDFVICDYSTLQPLLAIELDEPSHDAPDRQARDRQVESILKAAGLPLLRIATAKSYNTRELLNACGPYLMPSRP